MDRDILLLGEKGNVEYYWQFGIVRYGRGVGGIFPRNMLEFKFPLLAQFIKKGMFPFGKEKNIAKQLYKCCVITSYRKQITSHQLT